MLLTDLMKEDIKPEHKQLFQMLWDITEYLSSDRSLDGRRHAQYFQWKTNTYKMWINWLSFLGIHENMEAAPLKPYLTRTSYDLVFNLKQDAVNELYKKINFILGIAQRVAATRKRN